MASDFETVKKLREATGAGIMACQKAVQEANGDYEKAFDILRKKGIAKAGSKADRDAKDGLCGYLLSGKEIAILKVACETDFVARTEKFQNLVETLLKAVIDIKTNDIEALLNANYNGQVIKDFLAENIGIIGENIVIKSAVYVSLKDSENATFYVHNKAEGKDNIGRIVVCTIADCDNAEQASGLLKNINLHIASTAPVALNESSISQDVFEREKEIYKEQIDKLNKPADIANKMLDGKIRKFYEDNVLLKQAYVFDNNIKIEDMIKQYNKENSCELKLVEFYRLAI